MAAVSHYPIKTEFEDMSDSFSYLQIQLSGNTGTPVLTSYVPQVLNPSSISGTYI